MTKSEYCNLKGLHICNPRFNLNDELDDNFKKQIDALVEMCGETQNEYKERDV